MGLEGLILAFIALFAAGFSWLLASLVTRSRSGRKGRRRPEKAGPRGVKSEESLLPRILRPRREERPPEPGPQALNVLGRHPNPEPRPGAQTVGATSRIERLPRLKRAIVWLEVLGPPKGL